LLLLLIHDDSAGTLTIGLFLLGCDGLIHPAIGGLKVGVAGIEIIALIVGALTIHEVQVSHGVVVVLTKLEGLVEQADAFLDDRRVVILDDLADLLVLER